VRPYRVWGYPWIPIAHLIGSLAIFCDLLVVKTRYCVFGLLVATCAIPVYFWWKRRIAESWSSDLDLDVAASRAALVREH
jgi:basic amino acid/polyamine antiporter, APA family